MEERFISIDISNVDLEHSFFHYTNNNNLNKIFEKGLEPRIGENALYVEKTPKVFFVEGENGILTIMDVWLKWLTSKSKLNKFVYWFGTFYMRMPFYIKSIPNYIVKKSLCNLENRNKVYRKMREILENSVFLVLNLEENIDFDYNDIDEVKSRYSADYLKLVYPISSNLKDKKMEYWNMHTYSNKVIDPKKIVLLKDKGNYNANLILTKLIEQNIDYVKNNCEFLYEYFEFFKDVNKK